MGSVGRRGLTGAPGVQTITEVSGTATIDPGGTGSLVVTCPEGQAALSGGYLGSGYVATSGGLVVYVSRRSQQRGWEVAAKNTAPTALSMLVYAYCSPNITTS